MTSTKPVALSSTGHAINIRRKKQISGSDSESTAFLFAQFPDSEDLSRVTAVLKQQKIQHRFVLSGSMQDLLLLKEEDRGPVQEILDQWRNGQLETASFAETKKPTFSFAHKPAPLTLSLVFLGFLGAALAAFGNDFIKPFTFWSPANYFYFNLYGFNPWVDVQAGQVWRLITPIFIHFGPIHIIFNALWIWYLGTLVERHQSWLMLMALTLLIGLASNISQAQLGEMAIFGGLSGVVYGLFSYVWLYGRLNPDSYVWLPNILFVVVTVLMLLSPLGIFDMIVGGESADIAHISGYIFGAIAAVLISVYKKQVKGYGS